MHFDIFQPASEFLNFFFVQLYRFYFTAVSVFAKELKKVVHLSYSVISHRSSFKRRKYQMKTN